MFMNIHEKDACLKIAKEVSVFKEQEIEVLKEILEECKKHPKNEDYYVILEKEEETILGLVIFSKTHITEFAWDIYWLIVAKHIQGRGIGKRLLKKVEDFILQKEGQMVLRIETSTKHEFAHARNLYSRCGFNEAGRIPNFYAKNDDLIVYYKAVHPQDDKKNS